MYKKVLLTNNIIGDNMVKEIMSKNIISSEANCSIKEVATLMKEHNIGFIPIKENDKYIGVITDRDICLAIPTIKNIEDPIKDYITNNIIYIDSDSTTQDALSLMGDKKVKRLLVKEKDNIVGILSLSDILEFSNNENIIETFKTIFYIHDNNGESIAEIDEFYL